MLVADSSDEQLATVANEIEALVGQPNWGYDDIAVATKGSGERVTDGIDAFERTGIPTESTTMTGFGDDPAIRELLAVVRHFAADDGGEHPEHGSDIDRSRVDRMREMESIGDAVRWWVTDAGLKERVAERAEPLDVWSPFGNAL